MSCTSWRPSGPGLGTAMSLLSLLSLLSLSAAVPAVVGGIVSSDFFDYGAHRENKGENTATQTINVLPTHLMYTDEKIYPNFREERSANGDEIAALPAVDVLNLVRHPTNRMLGIRGTRRDWPQGRLLSFVPPFDDHSRLLLFGTDVDGEDPPFIVEHPAFGQLEFASYEHGTGAFSAPARPHPIVLAPGGFLYASALA